MQYRLKQLGKSEVYSCTLKTEKGATYWYMGQHTQEAAESVLENFKANIVDKDRIEMLTCIESGMKYVKVRGADGKLIAYTPRMTSEDVANKLIKRTIKNLNNGTI